MNIKSIQSHQVRSIITGSSTPALDILAAMGRNELEQSAKNKALEYFESRGGLQACATAEHNFCVQNDL